MPCQTWHESEYWTSHNNAGLKFQSNDTLEFGRSLDLSALADDMQKFHDIRVALRDIMYEHLDAKLVWQKQPQEARDAFEKVVSPSHVVLFYLFIIINCAV